MITDASHIAYIISAPAAAILLTILNGFTIFIFVKKFRLQHFSLIFIVNICLCDIFVCTFSNFFYAANLLHPIYDWSTGDAACRIFKMVTMTTNVAQIFSLCAINADRLRRLINFGTRQWNKTQAVRVLAIIWTVSFFITLPRPFIFMEKIIREPVDGDQNETSFTIVNIKCSPIDRGQTWYVTSTIGLFIVAYVLPTIYVLYTTIRAQMFMWRRRRQVHLANIKSKVTKMNAALSLTFNLTAAMFLAVWSPFFILSMVDLISDMVARKDLRPINFGLRCTLLIIGSAKPVIYLICLNRFRDAWKCVGVSRSSAEPSDIPPTKEPKTNTTNRTDVVKLSLSQPILQEGDHGTQFVTSTTKC